MSVTYSGPLVDWWNMAHPGQPFPSPVQHPQMFVGMNLVIEKNQYVGTPSCSNDMLCQHGVFDYECQIQNSCYLNLIELVVVLLIVAAVVFSIIWLVVFLCKHIDKLKIVLTPIVQACCCIGGFFKKMNCNFLRNRIAKSLKNKQQARINRLKQKMKKMNMEIELDQLTLQKQQQILKVVEQYYIVDDDV